MASAGGSMPPPPVPGHPPTTEKKTKTQFASEINFGIVEPKDHQHRQQEQLQREPGSVCKLLVPKIFEGAEASMPPPPPGSKGPPAQASGAVPKRARVNVSAKAKAPPAKARTDAAMPAKDDMIADLKRTTIRRVTGLHDRDEADAGANAARRGNHLPASTRPLFVSLQVGFFPEGHQGQHLQSPLVLWTLIGLHKAHFWRAHGPVDLAGMLALIAGGGGAIGDVFKAVAVVMTHLAVGLNGWKSVTWSCPKVQRTDWQVAKRSSTMGIVALGQIASSHVGRAGQS
eukprot:181006-Amphidinium_carterae.2